MAKTVRLDSLQLQVRQRANLERDQDLVPDTELTQYLNNSIGEFWDLLLAADSAAVRSTTQLAIIAGTDTYALPGDFYKLLGVEMQVTAGATTDWRDVRRCPFEERNRRTWSLPRPGGVPFRYFLSGTAGVMNLVLRPMPQGAATVRAWYCPVAPTLANPGDVLDGVDGLEEFVIVDAAIKCAQKEEGDVSVLLAQKQALVARIQAAAKDRDQSEPAAMNDVGMLTGWDGGYDDGFGGGEGY